MQHVTSNNVGSGWPTMLSPFAWDLTDTISYLKGPVVLIYYLFTIYLFVIEKTTFVKHFPQCIKHFQKIRLYNGNKCTLCVR